MKSLVLIDLEALYELYDEQSLKGDLCNVSASLEFSAVLARVSKYLYPKLGDNFEFKFFVDPDSAVVLQALDGARSPKIFATLNDEHEVLVCDPSLEIFPGGREKVSKVLKREGLSAFIGVSPVPVLVISPYADVLQELPDKAVKLRVSRLGELELPSQNWLSQLNGRLDFWGDTDNSWLLRFFTYSTRSTIINPYLQKLVLDLHRAPGLSNFQQITRRIQEDDDVGPRGQHTSDYGFEFLGNCVGSKVVETMKECLRTLGLPEASIDQYDLLYTDGELKLARLFQIYEAMPAEQRPKHLVLADDDYLTEFKSVGALYFCHRLGGLGITVHLIRVLQQAEFFPGWKKTLRRFAESCAEQATSLSESGYGLFVGTLPVIEEVDESQLSNSEVPGFSPEQ